MIRYVFVGEHIFALKSINSLIFGGNFQKAEKTQISYRAAAELRFKSSRFSWCPLQNDCTLDTQMFRQCTVDQINGCD